jgi:hypothetical protein
VRIAQNNGDFTAKDGRAVVNYLFVINIVLLKSRGSHISIGLRSQSKNGKEKCETMSKYFMKATNIFKEYKVLILWKNCVIYISLYLRFQQLF